MFKTLHLVWLTVLASVFSPPAASFANAAGPAPLILEEATQFSQTRASFPTEIAPGLTNVRAEFFLPTEYVDQSNDLSNAVLTVDSDPVSFAGGNYGVGEGVVRLFVDKSSKKYGWLKTQKQLSEGTDAFVDIYENCLLEFEWAADSEGNECRFEVQKQSSGTETVAAISGMRDFEKVSCQLTPGRYVFRWGYHSASATNSKGHADIRNIRIRHTIAPKSDWKPLDMDLDDQLSLINLAPDQTFLIRLVADTQDGGEAYSCPRYIHTMPIVFGEPVIEAGLRSISVSYPDFDAGDAHIRKGISLDGEELESELMEHCFENLRPATDYQVNAFYRFSSVPIGREGECMGESERTEVSTLNGKIENFHIKYINATEACYTFNMDSMGEEWEYIRFLYGQVAQYNQEPSEFYPPLEISPDDRFAKLTGLMPNSKFKGYLVGKLKNGSKEVSKRVSNETSDWELDARVGTSNLISCNVSVNPKSEWRYWYEIQIGEKEDGTPIYVSESSTSQEVLEDFSIDSFGFVDVTNGKEEVFPMDSNQEGKYTIPLYGIPGKQRKVKFYACHDGERRETSILTLESTLPDITEHRYDSVLGDSIVIAGRINADGYPLTGLGVTNPEGRFLKNDLLPDLEGNCNFKIALPLQASYSPTLKFGISRDEGVCEFTRKISFKPLEIRENKDLPEDIRTNQTIDLWCDFYCEYPLDHLSFFLSRDGEDPIESQWEIQQIEGKDNCYRAHVVHEGLTARTYYKLYLRFTASESSCLDLLVRHFRTEHAYVDNVKPGITTKITTVKIGDIYYDSHYFTPNQISVTIKRVRGDKVDYQDKEVFEGDYTPGMVVEGLDPNQKYAFQFYFSGPGDGAYDYTEWFYETTGEPVFSNYWRFREREDYSNAILFKDIPKWWNEHSEVERAGLNVDGTNYFVSNEESELIAWLNPSRGDQYVDVQNVYETKDGRTFVSGKVEKLKRKGWAVSDLRAEKISDKSATLKCTPSYNCSILNGDPNLLIYFEWEDSEGHRSKTPAYIDRQGDVVLPFEYGVLSPNSWYAYRLWIESTWGTGTYPWTYTNQTKNSSSSWPNFRTELNYVFQPTELDTEVHLDQNNDAYVFRTLVWSGSEIIREYGYYRWLASQTETHTCALERERLTTDRDMVLEVPVTSLDNRYAYQAFVEMETGEVLGEVFELGTSSGCDLPGSRNPQVIGAKEGLLLMDAYNLQCRVYTVSGLLVKAVEVDSEKTLVSGLQSGNMYIVTFSDGSVFKVCL